MNSRSDNSITSRENMTLFFNHKRPFWIPDIYRESCMVAPKCINEKPRGYTGDDWFGCKWIWDPEIGAPVPEIGHYRLDDITKWKSEITFPDIDSLDFNIDKSTIKSSFDADKMIFHRGSEGPFEKLRTILGFENALASLIEEPEACFDFMDEVANHKIRLYGRLLDEYPEIDFILTPDDWGTQKSGFFSQKMFRELIYPHSKKIADYVRSRGKFIAFHSCGCNMQYVSSMIEAGACLWEMQETANDTIEAVSGYGDQICLFFNFQLDFSGTPDAPNPALPENEAISAIHSFVDKYAPLGLIGAHTVGSTPELSKLFACELKEYSRNYYCKH